MQYYVCGIGVGINIKLGCRCIIARNAQGSAHNHYFTHLLGDAWLAADGQCNVCQWPNGDQGDFRWSGRYLLDYQVYCMLSHRCNLRLRKLYFAESVAPMDMCCVDGRAHQRLTTPSRYRDICAPCQFEQRQCIACGQVDRDVSTRNALALLELA